MSYQANSSLFVNRRRIDLPQKPKKMPRALYLFISGMAFVFSLLLSGFADNSLSQVGAPVAAVVFAVAFIRKAYARPTCQVELYR